MARQIESLHHGQRPAFLLRHGSALLAPPRSSQAESANAIRSLRGSIQCYSCFFRGYERAIYTSTQDSLFLADCESEACKCLVDTHLDGARTSKQWPLTILGGFFNLDAEDFGTPFADGAAFGGQFIHYTHAGQVLIQGCSFDTGPTHIPTFTVQTAGPASARPSLICIGNRFPNTDPFSAAGTLRLVALGNNGLDGSKKKKNLPDQTKV
jgi:hypothetical protein